jgi:hypothetical protein
MEKYKVVKSGDQGLFTMSGVGKSVLRYINRFGQCVLQVCKTKDGWTKVNYVGLITGTMKLLRGNSKGERKFSQSGMDWNPKTKHFALHFLQKAVKADYGLNLKPAELVHHLDSMVRHKSFGWQWALDVLNSPLNYEENDMLTSSESKEHATLLRVARYPKYPTSPVPKDNSFQNLNRSNASIEIVKFRERYPSVWPEMQKSKKGAN